MATLAVAMTLVRRTWDIFWRNGDPGGRQARCYSSIDDTKVLLTASKGGSLPGGDRKQAGRGQALSDGGFFRALPWGAVRERRSGDTPETPPGAAAPGPCREKPMLERGASPAPTIHDRDAQSSIVVATLAVAMSPCPRPACWKILSCVCLEWKGMSLGIYRPKTSQ